MAAWRIFGLAHHLAADVDVGVLAAERVDGDDHALDQQVRVVGEQLAVLAGAGLGLVGVDDQVDRAWRSLGMNDHFIPVGKPAPPRPRRLDFLTSSMMAAGGMRERLAEAPASRRAAW